MAPSQSPEDDARQHAIGGIVLESAYLERLLKAVFTALAASKYAVIPAASLSAGALIEQCQQLTDAHVDIAKTHKTQIRAAVAACAEAVRRRNLVVHDT